MKRAAVLAFALLMVGASIWFGAQILEMGRGDFNTLKEARAAR